MTKHATGTREEWLAQRLELLKAEKEHTRRGDELARRRQELPWVRVDEEYTFDTNQGKATLADLNSDFHVGVTAQEQREGGVDALWAMYQWLDRAPKGRNEHGVWWRRHDQYGAR